MLRRIAGYLVIAIILALAVFAGRAASEDSSTRRTTDERPAPKLTQSQAAAQLEQAGISWQSTGGCSAWYGSTCTSLEQINASTVDAVVALRRDSTCPVRLTAGTEPGHTNDDGGHWAGRQVTLAQNSCLRRYFQATYDGADTSGVRRPQWRTPQDVTYRDTGTRWEMSVPPG